MTALTQQYEMLVAMLQSFDIIGTGSWQTVHAMIFQSFNALQIDVLSEEAWDFLKYTNILNSYNIRVLGDCRLFPVLAFIFAVTN